MGDSKAAKASHTTKPNKEASGKGNSNDTNSKAKPDSKASNAADTKNAERRTLGETAKIMYGCQSFGA